MRAAAPLLALAAVAAAAPPPAAAALPTLDGAMAGLESYIAAAGPWGPAVFVAAYAAAAVALVPASALTLAAGFLFGPVEGTALVSAASTLGAAAAFALGRSLLRPAVAARAARDARFAAVDRAVTARGGRVVLLLRLSPLFPYGLLNYGLSLTGVGFGEYVGASWLGMLPGTVAYVGLGGAGRAAAEGAAGGGGARAALAVLGAAATLGAVVLVGRVAGAALREVTEAQGGDEARPLNGDREGE